MGKQVPVKPSGQVKEKQVSYSMLYSPHSTHDTIRANTHSPSHSMQQQKGEE